MRLYRTVAIFVVLAPAGCAAKSNPEPALVSHEPAGAEVLVEQMRQIFAATRKLSEEVRTEGREPRPQAVRYLLGYIEERTRLVAGTDLFIQHPLLRDNMRGFLREVQNARAGAERDPPNYVIAGSVSGGCLYCHEPKPCPFTDAICPDVKIPTVEEVPIPTSP